MKLYANIQAQKLVDGSLEIVKKGQGSNTLLSINIINENKALCAFIEVFERKGDTPVVFFTALPHHAYLATSRGEYDMLKKLEDKNSCRHDYDNYGKCVECGHWKGSPIGNKQKDIVNIPFMGNPDDALSDMGY